MTRSSAKPFTQCGLDFWDFSGGGGGGEAPTAGGLMKLERTTSITLCLNPEDIEQVYCFFKKATFVANDCIAIVRDVSDLGQVPFRRLF